MVTVLNRRELLCTFDMQVQAEVRRLLEGAGIDYKAAAHSRAAKEGRRMETLGEKPGLGVEYIIYVKKEDWEKAAGLMRTESRCGNAQ